MCNFRNDDRLGRSWRGLFAGAVVAFSIAGCGGDQLRTVPVEGKVLYQGEPLEFGFVELQPEVGPTATGEIQPNGTFSLSSYGEGDGAVLGTHRVRITCFEGQRPGYQPVGEAGLGRPLIPLRYANPGESGLTAEVTDSPAPNALVFELE